MAIWYGYNIWPDHLSSVIAEGTFYAHGTQTCHKPSPAYEKRNPKHLTSKNISLPKNHPITINLKHHRLKLDLRRKNFHQSWEISTMSRAAAKWETPYLILHVWTRMTLANSARLNPTYGRAPHAKMHSQNRRVGFNLAMFVFTSSY